MAKTEPLWRDSVKLPDIALFINKMSLSSSALTVTTSIEKEFMRLLEHAKNEANNDQLRWNLESALEVLSKNASRMMWQDSHEQANFLSFCARIMSATVSLKDVDLIKLVFVCLATWLTPDSVSKVANACQQHGWRVMKDTYSIVVGKQEELGDGCRMLQALVDGSNNQIPQTFIDEELAILLGRSDILYASDAPELIWILRRGANRDQNQSIIFRLVQKNIWNSSFLVEFLNLLYCDNDANTKVIRNKFFERLLPISALTISFVPYKQPLHGTDDASSLPVESTKPNECSEDKEEKLFNEWEQHWKHLDEDQVPEAAKTNPAIEVINGQRLYDEPLGGKELAMLIQAASQLGYSAVVKQMLDLMVPKLGKTTPEQCHAILLAFLDTMLLRKLGRATLEKHKSDFCAMIGSYIHHYLAPPTADMARPLVECQCVRCKTLNKFLDDPELETKPFVNETPGRHQHLLEQIQIAHHRFTWDYRYGPKYDLSGEKRGEFPNAWSSKLRTKRFPKRWVANKGYEYTTEENQHVKELTITKIDKKLTLTRKNFQERMKKAEQLQARVEGSRLGGKFWTDAMNSTRLISRTEISQSQRMLQSESTAKKLVAAFAEEVASKARPLPIKDEQPLSSKQLALGSSQSSKRVVSNGQVTILNSDSENDSDNDTSRTIYLQTHGKLGNSPLRFEFAVPRYQSPPRTRSKSSLSSPRDGTFKSQKSIDDHDQGCTAILRRLQHGVWKLSDEQISIDLGSAVLFSADFLRGLEDLSKSSKVTWEDALAVLVTVRDERSTSKAWIFADTGAALERILHRSHQKHAERTQGNQPLIRSSSLVFSPEPLSKSQKGTENQSTTPPGDPPWTWKGFGSFASGPVPASKKSSKEKARDLGQKTKHPNKPAAHATIYRSTRIAMTASAPTATPITIGKGQAIVPASSSTTVPARGSVHATIRGIENSGNEKPSDASVRGGTLAIIGSSSVPTPSRFTVHCPQNVCHKKTSDASTRSKSPIVPMPQTTKVQQASSENGKANFQNSQAKVTQVINLDEGDSEDSDISDASDGITPGWPSEVKEILGELNNAVAIRTIRAAGVILSPRQAIKVKSMIKGDPSSAYRITKKSLEKCLGQVECQDHKTGRPIYCNDNWVRISESVDRPRASPAAEMMAISKKPVGLADEPPAISLLQTTLLDTNSADRRNAGVTAVSSSITALASMTPQATDSNERKNNVQAESRAVTPVRTTPLIMNLGSHKSAGVTAHPRVVPATQMTPLVKNSGNKRNADAAGLSSNEGSASTRRKTDVLKKATTAVVIDLIDFDDEKFVANLPEGSKRKPIVFD